MPAGPSLTRARRIAAESSPPDRRWLMAAANPSPVDPVHTSRPGLPFFKSCCAHRNILIKSSLVLSTETRLGQAALVVAAEAILATCPLVAEVEAVAEGPCEGPWHLVMPRRSLSFWASPGGLPVPGGLSCPVCLALEGCPVPVCLAPEGSWYPLTSPGNFFWGVEGFRLEWPGRGMRPRPWKTTCHGLLSSLHRHGLQSSQLRHGLRHLFRSGGPCPVVLSVSVLRGLQSTHPPSRWNCYGVGHAFREGGVMSGFCCGVSCVPASCVHIWFVSCPRQMWLLVN